MNVNEGMCQGRSGTANAADVLADRATAGTVCAVAEERLLMLAHNTKMAARMGRSMALLFHIVVGCGTNDSCRVNLHTVAEALGAPYSTVKSWLSTLEASELVFCTPHGRDGIELRLNTELVPRRPVLTRAAEALARTRTILAALQTTVASAVAGAESALRAEEDALS